MQQAGTALIGANRGQHRFMHGKGGKNTRYLKGAADAVTRLSRAATAPPNQGR